MDVLQASTQGIVKEIQLQGRTQDCFAFIEWKTLCIFESVDVLQASTQGLVKELQQQGKAQGARVLCPVPLVTGGLVEPPVVPRFLKALQVKPPGHLGVWTWVRVNVHPKILKGVQVGRCVPNLLEKKRATTSSGLLTPNIVNNDANDHLLSAMLSGIAAFVESSEQNRMTHSLARYVHVLPLQNHFFPAPLGSLSVSYHHSDMRQHWLSLAGILKCSPVIADVLQLQ